MNGIHEVTGSTPVWSTTSNLLVGLYFASVDHLLDIPSERQARELVPLDPEIQRKVWEWPLSALKLALKTWPHRSGRRIAEQLGCSASYVNQVHGEVFTSEQQSSRITGKDGKRYPSPPNSDRDRLPSRSRVDQ